METRTQAGPFCAADTHRQPGPLRALEGYTQAGQGSVAKACQAHEAHGKGPSTTAYTGCYWHARTARWRAQVSLAGTSIHVGYYPTKQEASRDAAVYLVHGR